jgi:hypothetical protein
MKVEESNHGSRRLADLLLLVASAVLSPPPATPAPKPISRPWTEWVSALSAVATVLLTGGIVWLGYVQYTVSHGQLSVMQRQLDDAEIKDSASIVIRNLAITGFPDHMVVSADISNIGPTRAEMVSIVPGFRWMPGRDLFTAARDPKFLIDPASPEGFTLDPSGGRHVEMPMSGADPSKFPENVRALLPTPAQLISGEFTSVVSVSANYKTIFGRTEHAVECLVYMRQQFHPCWGDSKRIGDQLDDRQ